MLGLRVSNLSSKRNIFFGVFISFITFFSGFIGLGYSRNFSLDYTEGGSLEADFGTFFMSEWWYLNGEASLIAEDGEEEEIGFFVVLGHTESPSIIVDGVQFSHLSAFHGLYVEEGGNEFHYEETYVPQIIVGDFISIHSPYVSYVYPIGEKMFAGSAITGYYLNYVSENLTLNLYFYPDVDKTVDQAYSPLNFTTYEQSYGKLIGSVELFDKHYLIDEASGYLDHMIPVSRGYGTWPMEIHGWNWFEVTTEKYQAVFYAIRGLEDGYSDYSYKHLTILNRHSGRVLAEYSGDDINITELNWIDELGFNMMRPQNVILSTLDGTVVSVSADNMHYFDTPYEEPTGFVDFMAYQFEGSQIQYRGTNEIGSSFFEYMVTDIALLFG